MPSFLISRMLLRSSAKRMSTTGGSRTSLTSSLRWIYVDCNLQLVCFRADHNKKQCCDCVCFLLMIQAASEAEVEAEIVEDPQQTAAPDRLVSNCNIAVLSHRHYNVISQA